jgi:histidinol-phosphate/aromatic aminotransferase/cobyric acid decarboxylase-like protein
MRHLLEELPTVRRVHDSGGNFLLVELAGEDPGIASRLRRDLLASSRIEVKDISGKYPDRRPRLRLAVRTQEDNDRLLQALRALATEAGS